MILEREYAGFGASGRNGGWASAIFPISLSKVAKIHLIKVRYFTASNE